MNTQHPSRWPWQTFSGIKTQSRFILRSTICALALFSLLYYPLPAFAADNISVQVECKPGVGVAGAEVKLYRVEANGDTSVARDLRTDKSGRVNMRDLKEGTYELRVVCPGGETFTHKLSFGGGVDASYSYLFRCCPWPPGAPPPGGDGLIGIDGTPVTPDVTADSRAVPKAKVVTANGLRTVTFDTLQGQVIVNLPDDMRAGDTISGTVVAEPKGNTEPEQAKNMSVLSGYAIDIHQRETTGAGRGLNLKVPLSASSQLFTLLVPPPSSKIDSGSSNAMDIILTGPTPPPPSTELGPVRYVSPSGIATVYWGEPQHLGQPAATPSPSNLYLPEMGQQGRPIEIFSPSRRLGGNATKTKCQVGGQDVKIIAASPGKVIFESPPNIAGLTDFTLIEGNVETKGPFRNVGVNLSAPKTNLLKGEHTTLTVEFYGFAGIKKPVPATLESHGGITMEGGMFQPLVIQPSEVGADGRYTTTRGVTGVQTGVWSSTVTVVTQPFNIVLRDPSPPQTILVNSFTGDYAFCGAGFKLGGTGQIKRQGCVITLTDNKPDRQVQGTLNACTPVDNGTFFFVYSAGTPTDIQVVVTDTNPKRTKVYFKPSSRPAPPVQDVSAFATCP